MTDLHHLTTRMAGLHAGIAADLFTPGSFHQCRVCGVTQPLTAELVAQYLTHGWPTHCGRTMHELPSLPCTVLSLNPPWGSLIAACDGWPELGKHYETRSWKIKLGTQLAIYQTKGLGEQTKGAFVALCGALLFGETLTALGYGSGYGVADALPRGAILVTCRIVACHPTEQIRAQLSRRELAFGNYDDGRYAWELGDVRRLLVPVPATATKQGLWVYYGPLLGQKEV